MDGHRVDVADAGGGEEELRVGLRRLAAVAEESQLRRAELETALTTGIVIEQAKGILAERIAARLREKAGLPKQLQGEVAQDRA